ncbi:hypothetical protein KFL_003250070 [Klebsormidium nitens]|uniref:S-adenosyl-L-methionine-dependent methyltransferases superfamily protein n=1 Tax=Klebsormidium nitens TaxID=105231 RepID=A0A1Y1I7Q5_KLENI|nr:hypothetical protein KFL_003250070 [Klebsormidium nitens]|eukprot:GAQ87004.1 hypothetical protein KFL_003250070 [Klebsormidium nitens]
MGKNGGKHRREKNNGDIEFPTEEIAQQEVAGVSKPHRKSKSRNAATHEADALSGPSKYLLASTEGSSTENKHALYQRAVQSPKGDISYLVKFFLTYVGGRVPVHLREDFCGTALICAEWLRPDVRRTATGLDLDDDALRWGASHNIGSLPDGGGGRMCLLLGNVLQPIECAQEIPCGTVGEVSDAGGKEEGAPCSNEQEIEKGSLQEANGAGDVAVSPAPIEGDWEMVGQSPKGDAADVSGTGRQLESLSVNGAGEKQRGPRLSKLHTAGADIICAFNYSTCCLHSRQELLRYFHHARKGLSSRGGVFAMDLYGGTSSECALRLKRRFGDFTYTWEQEEFDAVTRMTRISLHFRLENTKKTIKNAFSYQWRLWTIPEARECLLEAGFSAVHVWMREMPDLEGHDEDEEVEVDANSKYVECKKFLQCDAWNAYIVAVN